MTYRFSLLAAWLLLCPHGMAADQVLISEFMADNNRTLVDQDGDASDWVELFNSGVNTVSLAGWHLTDDRQNLALWTFPSVSLAPGEFRIVFASGKNRYQAQELHTNFQLDSAGEYLALVAPDLALVQEFDPYPPQVEDVAYGIARVANALRFVTNGMAVRWRVPRSAADLPVDWTQPDYDASGWAAGLLGIGFDTASGGAVEILGVVTNLARGKGTSQSSDLGAFLGGLAVNGSLTDFTHTLAGQNLPATWEVDLGGDYAIERIVLRNRVDCCGSRLRDVTVRILDHSDATTHYTSALLNPENALSAYPDGPATLALNLISDTGGPIVGGRVRVTRSPDPDLAGTGGQGNQDEADVLSLAEVEVLGFAVPATLDSLVGTDLEGALFRTNATALVRVPFSFNLEESFQPIGLSLQMRYDDGFVAWLNGMEVARRNAPSPLEWNSGALAERPDLLAFLPEPIDLSGSIGLLRDGDNVLAIQGLNRTAEDDDFLVLPELTGQGAVSDQRRYFARPTPGQENTSAYLGLVADTKFTPDRGFYETNIAVGITCATPGAIIRYTTNGAPPTETTGSIYTGPIPVGRTTVLRAAAFLSGWRPSDVDTHTYFYVRDIPAQTFSATTNAGFPLTWGGIAPDYGMDPDVVGPADRYGGKYAATVTNDLRALPTLSIAMLTGDLFGADGIYTLSTSRGLAYERPASLELIYPDGEQGFQVNCGLRLQGGAFREHSLTKKHAFHLVFKSLYEAEAGKLNYPLFGTYANATDSFDDLVLRANSNDGWQWSGAGSKPLYVRDSFGRESMLEMGGVASHEAFHHVYLNGIYWGLYNTVERPDAAFACTYFGGEKDDWDSQNSGTPSNGDLAAWNMMLNMANAGLGTDAAYERIQGNNPDGTRNPALTNLLDVGNLIDYMIVNLYVGNTDWPHKNFWVGRDRSTNSTGFKFFMWDSEWSMGLQSDLVTDRTGVSDGVARPYARCRANLEFRVRFGDHLQRHFFNGGAFYVDPQNQQWDSTRPDLNRPAARFVGLCERIDRAIVAESARWGDQHGTLPYTRDQHWIVERTNLLRNYFPRRSGIVLSQFRAAGLYPSVAAPLFNLYGGSVPQGFELVMTNPNTNGGTIFFTVNGGDPRRRGGNVHPDAQAYSAPVTLNASTEFQARVRSGTNWSALVRATFFPPQDVTGLRLTELMYHPPAFGINDGDEVEFVELKNTGPTAIDLTGISFVAGINFTFTNGTTLAPGAFFVLVRNPTLFQARYPGKAYDGVYTGRLANEGETLRLAHPVGGSVFAVTYQDAPPWPQTADGLGFSLVPLNPGSPDDLDQPGTWRPSAVSGGSPGADDPAPNIPRVLINEVLAASNLPPGDAIELVNPSTSPANIGGWFLTDETSQPKKFRIPDGTMLGAGEFRVFTEADFNPTPGTNGSFALQSDGDLVCLFSGDAHTNLTGYSHGFRFEASPRGVTLGRWVISTGEEQFPLQTMTTLGGANAGPRMGPLVISEIHYHPDLGDDEFIELQNPTGTPVPLYDPAHPTNTWRLSGLNYDFPTNVILAPNGLLLLVREPPATFRARHGVLAEVPILGPYVGALQDSGERLELKRPDVPGSDEVDYITVDAVRYNDRAPWPPVADGGGASLQRKAPGLYGNDPVHWEAATPTPGLVFTSGTPPQLTQEPASKTVVAYRDHLFLVTAVGPAPLHYQWHFNGAPIPEATNSFLFLPSVQPSQEGDYSVVVFNQAGSVTSSNAVLTVLIPATILAQPQSVVMRASTNEADYGSTTNRTTFFSVAAISAWPITYQWHFNGAPIPPALNPTSTNATLTVSNVSLLHAGVYDAVLTDATGSIRTAPATLNLLLSPRFIVIPPSQSVVANGSITLGAAIVGGPPPFLYQLRRFTTTPSTAVAAILSNERTVFFNLPRVQLNQGGLHGIVISNAATTVSTIAQFTLTVLADADGDGQPDHWETAYGLNHTNELDRAIDSDADGMLNWQEYIAGTDPTNALSYLKVERLNARTGPATLEFLAISNRTYTVEFTESLSAGSWSKLTDLLARATNRLENVLDPAARPQRSYRLRTPRKN